MTAYDKSNKKKHVKIPTYPNQKTNWAYYMQAIEPTCKKLNQAFPGYHPLWVQQSQKLKPSPQLFKYYREYVLKASQKQIAAYLRVSCRQLNMWEEGTDSLPFMAFELLRLVYVSAHFRLSHKDWDGWFINDNGRLVCPDRGNLSFEPGELTRVREINNANYAYLNELTHLQSQIAPMKAEIEKLKRISYSNSVVEEINELNLRLTEVVRKIKFNHISKLTELET